MLSKEVKKDIIDSLLPVQHGAIVNGSNDPIFEESIVGAAVEAGETTEKEVCDFLKDCRKILLACAVGVGDDFNC